jgi:crotonobetaine/carnitine-CoA ligase
MPQQLPEQVALGRFEYRQWTLTHLLRTNVEERPDNPALRDADVTLTYRQAWDRASRMAAGLRSVGVGPDDRVLTMLDNSVDYAVVVIALNFVGAVPVPTNTMYRGNILTHVVKDSGVTVAIVEAHLVETLTRFDDGVLTTFVVRGDVGSVDVGGRPLRPFGELEADNRPAVDPVGREPWDPLLVGYTSGTTGASKGVLVTNAHLVFASDPYSIQGVLGGEDEVLYISSPMFHMLALGGILTAFIVGGSVYIAAQFSASTFIEDVTRVGATHTSLVSAMGEFIMQQPPSEADARCTLRTAYMLPVHSRREEFVERFGIALRSSYGGTEVGGVISTGDDPEAIERGSCGRARPGMEIRLVDEHDMEVPVGEPGECMVRHVHPWTLCAAYLGNPEATAAGWRNGWFHTGDLLKRDADDYFYFVDRKKDAIRRRGENVSSMEVEAEVLRHPEVLECAAVAVDIGESDQEIKIVVVRRPSSVLTEEGLTKFLIDRLPRYAVPRYVRFSDELPRTPTLKVRKEQLRKEQNDGCWDRVAAGIVLPR